MIVEDSEFVFEAPKAISRARRVLIKPNACQPVPYPVTTSRQMLELIIDGIRQMSDADIILLDGTPDGSPVKPIYQELGYIFPRVLTLDVKDCVWVEVDNPLDKPFAVPTFWVPNVILSSDYLISVTPLKVIDGQGDLSIMNLLSLLPGSKYSDDKRKGWAQLYDLGIDKVLADLYFTLPFDLGIIEARKKIISRRDAVEDKVEEYGKIFIGEPYEVDTEVAETLGIKTNYLSLIKEARETLGTNI